MMKWTRMWMGLALVGVAPMSVAEGQQRDVGCDYEACALYVSEWEDGWRIVRGPQKEWVIPRGLWVGDLSQVFAGSREAQTLAARYRRTQNTGTTLAVLGVASLMVPVAVKGGRPKWGWVVLGISLSGVGTYQISRAQDHLFRAVQVYNADLRRRSMN